MSLENIPASGQNRRTGMHSSVLAAAAASLLLAFSMAGCGEKEGTAPKPAGQEHPNPTAVIETDLGTIKFELLEDQAPKTTENFRRLAERGYYNGLIFHRVISGFMIQGGDPNGNGTGGETATRQPLPNEVNRTSPLYRGGYQRGFVAMANKGTPETGSSQFFIMHQTYPLAPNYTIFGRVVEGMEVVDKIASAPNTGASSMNRPVTPVKMNKVYVQ